MLSQDHECQFRGFAEGAVDAVRAEGVDHVVGQAEGDELGLLEGEALVEEAVEVDVEGAAGGFFEEDVLAVAVAEAEDVADDGHDGAGAGVAQAGGEPGRGLGKLVDEPFVEGRGELGEDAVGEDGCFGGGGGRFVEEGAELVVVDGDVFLLVEVEEDVAEGFEVVDPFDEAAFFVKRGDGVGFDVEAPLAGFGVFLQGPVDHGVEFHKPLVFAQVVFGFAEQGVDVPIRPADADPARFLKRIQD